METKRLVIDAALIALYVVLSFVSASFGVIKLTFASFAVLVGALLYGWADGLLIGAMGEFICQLLTYGLTVTTPLWMLPAMARGLIVGLYAQKHGFNMTNVQVGVIVLISSIVVTTLNSGVIWLDAKIFGYPAGLTLGVIGLRYLNSVITAVVYALITPKTVALLRNANVGAVGRGINK